MVRVEIEPGRREPGVAAATRRRESVHQAPEAVSTEIQSIRLVKVQVAKEAEGWRD